MAISRTAATWIGNSRTLQLSTKRSGAHYLRYLMRTRFAATHLKHAHEDEIQETLKLADALPAHLAAFLTALREDLTRRGPTQRGRRAETYSLRDLDNAARHGMPAVYLDCSPTDTGWAPVEAMDESPPDMSRLVGLIMLPPDTSGRAFISLVTDDVKLLTITSSRIASLIHRLTRAYLATIAPGLVDPLAAVGDYPT